MNSLEKEVLEYAELNKNRLFDELSALVKLDSQNFITHGNEINCQRHVEKRYRELGLDVCVYNPDDLPGFTSHEGYNAGRGTDKRPNVSGVLRGATDESVMLAAHADTMPVGERSKWTVDPFGGERKDGRLYGLGSGDDKFGIAVGIFALETLRACGVKLQKSVVLTSYADEEYGGGNGALAACLKYPCETVLNLDGLNEEMWVSSVGGGGAMIDVKTNFITDTAWHCAEGLGDILEALRPFAKRRRDEMHKNPLYSGSEMEEGSFRLIEFKAGSLGANLDLGQLQFMFYTDSDKSAIMAEFAALEKEIGERLAPKNMTTGGFRMTTRFFDYCGMDDKTGACSAFKSAAEEVSGREIRTAGGCLSDLALFLNYGSLCSFTYGIGRDFSKYGGAHQPDEFVELEKLTDAAKSVILFLLRHCGSQKR